MPDALQPRDLPAISISRTTTESNHTGSWKHIQPAYHDCEAPCRAACPTGVDIQGYLTFLREGRLDEAMDLLLTENPMPAITGRVCNHPCEEKCNRTALDGAVAIHSIERSLGDLALQRPLPKLQPPARGERVAIIGSGPAGLACAYHLTRLGYSAEVFEQEEQAGGMLRVGIPEYRLPRQMLNRQLELYGAMGIQIHTGVRIGRDLSWEQLTGEFSAIFVASGAHVSRLLRLRGTAPEGTLLSGLEFLRAINRGQRPRLGERVIIVIGGGNTAMDCARTALRLGAEVTVVYRRTREEMPAIAEEIEDAESEGINFVYLASPESVNSAGGKIALCCRPMELSHPDEQGRRSVVPSTGPPIELAADSIISAIGEEAELDALPLDLRNSTVETDEWGCSRLQNIFLGGDVAGDTRTVASALGAGKRAAIGIDRFLCLQRGEQISELSASALRIGNGEAFSMARWTSFDPVERVQPLNDVASSESVNLSSFTRAAGVFDLRRAGTGSFDETNLGITHSQAVAEASRCFQCGVCNQCELCNIYCSEAAIRLDANGGRFVIDLDHCKGCGVCVFECPRGAMRMESVAAAN